MGSSKKHSEPSPPAARAAERLAVIVDAAERAALNVIDDAEKEAQRYLQEAQARADRMVAEKLREAADRVEQQGIEATEPLLRPVRPEPAPPPRAPEPPPAKEPPAVEAPPPPVEERPTSQSGSAAARLLATQMAVSGSSRTEIEMRLRSGFQIEDTNEILDAILGPEG